MKVSSVKRSWSLPDPQHLKALRSNSNQRVPRKTPSPWLMLFPRDGGCVLYNPDEVEVLEKPVLSSENRFLANSGKWSLMLDSHSNLFVIDVFSDLRLILPPLVQFAKGNSTLKRLGDREFRWELIDEEDDSRVDVVNFCSNDLRARLWVDEDDKADKLSVVWYFYPSDFYSPSHLCLYKSGDPGYTVIPLHEKSICKPFRGFIDMVLRGYRLYIYSIRNYVRVLDFSGQQVKDVSTTKDYSPVGNTNYCSLAVTTAGEVLLVEGKNFEGNRYFRIFKHDPFDSPGGRLCEVPSLGDEALLLDWGITVPANHAFGIKPNCIYFTRHDLACAKVNAYRDICVFNLSTKKHTRFPAPGNLIIKDARWFLPAG